MKNNFKNSCIGILGSLLVFVFLFFLFFPFFTSAALVPCGRSDQGNKMCTLCDLIVGFKGIVDYGFKIIVAVAIVMLMISGIVYIVSAGDTGMMDTAKGLMKNTLIGFSIILGAWLIVEVTMWVLATKGNTDEGGTLGIKIESWNKFKCE